METHLRPVNGRPVGGEIYRPRRPAVQGRDDGSGAAATPALPPQNAGFKPTPSMLRNDGVFHRAARNRKRKRKLRWQPQNLRIVTEI